MPDLITAILTLCLVLVLLALIGHGIWVVFAKLFRWLSGDREPTAIARQVHCPVCGSRQLDENQCVACGWNSRASTAAIRERVTREQLKILVQNGSLQLSDANKVIRALDVTQQRQVARQRSARAASDGPVVPEVVRRPDHVVPKPSVKDVPEKVVPPAPIPAPRPSMPEPATPSVAHTPEQLQSDIHDRFEEYARERSKRVSAVPEAILPPREPRVPWQQWLQAFMEQKNIRWGELVGGLLIVTCSIALVISFWSEIAERPLLKFGLFNGTTAFMFLIGLFAASHWKLPTTSQGILMTASMLVPLNFLAIASFAPETQGISAVAVGGEVMSLLLLGTFVFLAARVFEPGWATWLTAGLMLPCAGQLATRRFVGDDSSMWTVYLFAVVISLPFFASQVPPLLSLRSQEELDEPEANSLLKHLGLLAFSMLVALGLLLFRTGRPVEFLHWLTPLSVMIVLPLAAVGWTIWQRGSAELTSLRVVGTSLVVLASMILVGACLFSWPQPATMLALTVFGFVLITLVSEVVPVREGHTLGALLFGVSLVLLVLVATGNLTWIVESGSETLEALCLPVTGRTLTGVSFATLAIAGVLVRRKQMISAGGYGLATILAAILSLLVLVPIGMGKPGDPERLTWVFALYGLVAFGAAWYVRSAIAFIVGCVLWQSACSQGIVYGLAHLEVSDPWPFSVLVNTTLVTVIGAVLHIFHDRDDERFRSLMPTTIGWGIATISLVLLAVLAIAVNAAAPINVAYITWSGALLIALAWCGGITELWLGGQAVLIVAAMIALDHRLEKTEAYEAVRWGWMHPVCLQCQGILLAAFGWLSLAVQTAIRFGGLADRDLTFSRWMTAPAQRIVERVCVGLAMMVLWFTALYAVLPTSAQELTPMATALRLVPELERFQYLDLPADQAAGVLAWGLAGLVIPFVFIGRRSAEMMWSHREILLATIPLLLLVAAWWQPQIAVASALRWTSAIYFALASVGVWCAPRLTKRFGGELVGDGDERSTLRDALPWLISVVVIPVVAMMMYVSLGALNLQQPSPLQLERVTYSAIVCIVLAIGVVVANQLDRGDVRVWSRAAGSLLVLSALPFLAFVVMLVAGALASHPIVGPEPDSFFAEMGLAASYATPLILIAVTVIGHAIFFESSGIAFAGALLLNASVTTLYLLTIKTGSLSADEWVRLVQLNGIVSAGYSLGWTAYKSKGFHFVGDALGGDGWHRMHQSILAGLMLIPALAVLAHVWGGPRSIVSVVGDFAGVWGWLALLLAVAAIWLFEWLTCRSVSAVTLVLTSTVGLMIFVAQLGVPVSARNLSSSILTHVTEISFGVLAMLVLLIERFRSDDGKLARPLSIHGANSVWLLIQRTLIWLVILFIGLVGLEVDPQRPWWSVGCFLLLATICVECGQRNKRQRYFFGSTLLLMLAASGWYLVTGRKLIAGDEFANFQYLNLFVLASVVPLAVFAWRRGEWPARRMPNLQQVGSWVVVAVFALLVAGGLIDDLAGYSLTHASGVMVALAWAAMLLSSFSRLWDARRRVAGFLCYFSGLITLGLTLDRLDLDPFMISWLGTLLLAAYGLGTSYLWSRRRELDATLAHLGVPAPTGEISDENHWLVGLNGLLACVVAGLAIWIQFTCEHAGIRLAASQAVGAMAISIGLLARGRRATELRYVALCFGVLAAIVFGFSWRDPATLMNRWLDDWIVVAVALMVMSVFYGVGLTKVIRRENDWTVAGQALMPMLGILSVVSLVVVLISEVVLYLNWGQAEMSAGGILAVSVALVAAAVGCLIAAVVPGRDPFNWSEKKRTIYVYVAEGLIAALCLHLRVTFPELFSGIVAQYWTLVVMAIAFAGVAMSEWFRRRQHAVLAEPLERTGVLLPLLPVIGFWVGDQAVHYSAILLAAGAIYSVMSLMRRSFGFGVLAAVAANGGLWYFLQHDAQIGLLVHPQLWLIPLAVSILVAAYLNREQLTSQQFSTIRYICGAMIYLSSTADIFLVGVAQQPWLPIVLATLSIIGILLGIMLRVRAFLFLGFGFLLVSLMTMIWHASVNLDYPWIWWVFGIVTGALIFVMFALFERKRQEVLEVIDRVRHWDG